jgi:uncharacterized protein
MTQPAKAQEPSMEEILASIRRIIADDDATKSTQRAAEAPKAEPPPAPPPPPQPAAFAPPPPSSRPYIEPESDRPELDALVGMEDQSSDILELTESMAAPMPPPAGPAPQFRTIDAASDVGFEEPLPVRPSPAPAADPGALISNETSAAVDAAFNTLAQTVLAKNARTLEDLVREMLRPMLKTWLDDNLPSMVERLVRAEIERVSRGGPG